MSRIRREKNPMQPIRWDQRRVIRFKENRIVSALLDWATPRGYDMNTIAVGNFSDDDRTQFAQLIGYSVSGVGDLSYFNRKVLAKADAYAAALHDRRARRYQRNRKSRKVTS